MARQTNRLTARSVAGAKEPGMYPDGNGLYLQVAKGGSKSWIFRYMLRDKARHMGLGGIDTVSLSEARMKRDLNRKLVKDGTDPIKARKDERRAHALQEASSMTFAECADRLIAAHEAGWRNAKHRQQWRNTLATYAYPVFGDVPVDAIDTGHVMQAIEPIWTKKTKTASRVRGRIEAVLDWAKARGYREGENPARWRGHLSNLLPKQSKISSVKHHEALPYDQMAAFMKTLRERGGSAARALELLILTAARPGEVVGAKWDEIDLDSEMWTVPAERMKSNREHRVPLSGPAVTALRQIAEARISDYVFPGQSGKRPLCTDSLR